MMMTMKMIDQLIRKVVLPVAEQNGYYLDPERIPSGWWDFKKDSPKQPAFYIVFRPPNQLGLFFRIQSIKHSTPEIDRAWWAAHKPYRPFTGWWSFSTQEDQENILRLYALALQEKGFAMLNQLEQEPEKPDSRLYATREIDYRLYQNYKRYQQEFFERYPVDRLDRKQILQILQEKANNWKRSDEDAVEELLRITAVFGSLFDCLEATWIWNEKLGATQIVFPCKWKHMFAYPPASQIFSLIQLNGKGETLLNEYCGFLKLTGHYEMTKALQ